MVGGAGDRAAGDVEGDLVNVLSSTTACSWDNRRNSTGAAMNDAAGAASDDD